MHSLPGQPRNRACEASLRRLGTDWIDLYYLHVVDAKCPLDETLRAMDDLVRQGKVRYIATSKHPAALIVEALWLADRTGTERVIAEQSPYSLLDRRPENNLHYAARRYGVGLCPFGPLAKGRLSGKYSGEGKQDARRGRADEGLFTDAINQAVDDLQAVADDVGCSLSEMALAWTMAQPGVTAPVVGMRKADYVQSALRACELQLEPDVLNRIDEICPPGENLADIYVRVVTAPCRNDYAPPVRRTAYLPAERPAPRAPAPPR